MNNEQQIAFDKFSKLRVGALFMKMGTGKTKVALELVNYNNIDFLIYVTPFSTKSNIENEIKKWGLNCDYEIVGYETIQSSSTKYLELLNKLDNKKCFIVADESIFIKNEETKRFKRLCNLREKCEYALILNGTPLTKNEWDIYNQMFFLSPKIIGMNRTQFLNVFFKKITYKKKGHRENTFYKFSDVNAEMLQKMINPYIFECDLKFNQSEKAKINYVCYDDEEYYIEKENKLEEYRQSHNSDAIINLLSKLNVISSSNKLKNDEVIEYIRNKKIIVFSNFLAEIEYISSKIDCYTITGRTKERNDIIENFKNDNKPLLMTFGVGSYSLNLQFCDEIVYTSLNFDYAKIEQSKYRIKRIGQDKDIKYTYFLSDLGINRLILDNLDKKKNLDEIIKEKLENGKIEEFIKNI